MKNFRFIAAFAAILILSLLAISCVYAQENEDIETPMVEQASDASSADSGSQTDVAALIAHVNKKFDCRPPSKNYSRTYNDYRSYHSVSRPVQRMSTRRLERQIGRVGQQVNRLQINMNNRFNRVDNGLSDITQVVYSTNKSVGEIQRQMVTKKDLKTQLDSTGVKITLCIIIFIVALAVIGLGAALSQRR